MKHPIRKHVSLTIDLSLADAQALAAVIQQARDVRGIASLRAGLARALDSLNWIPRLEANMEAAGLAG